MTDQRRRARIVEAYPVTETADGSRVAPSLAYTGPISIFEEQGFKVVQRLSPTRPLMRRTLRALPVDGRSRGCDGFAPKRREHGERKVERENRDRGSQ